ncbi:hypothetical protein KC347_g277 [Hortaea werneckii]|nr:hypothetical protein KC347_g277 [Hortaea werneckii]
MGECYQRIYLVPHCRRCVTDGNDAPALQLTAFGCHGALRTEALEFLLLLAHPKHLDTSSASVDEPQV